VRSPVDGSAPLVPRFADDGRTQLGTGFNELTADGRATLRLGVHELTVATQAYRQFDSPRTDQCAPPFARADECLMVREQFRTLSWAAWTARPASGPEELRVTASWQRQHELREGARPASYVLTTGRDVVDTLGVAAMVRARRLALGSDVGLGLAGGVDSYLDLVDSQAFVTFTDVRVTQQQSRGQYLSGSTSLTGGAFLDATAWLGARVTLRAGGRLGWAHLTAPADAASGSQAVVASFLPLAGHAGVEWAVAGPLSLLARVDRSFRAPNLDDLTSRQQTGPGFQFENPALRPEGAVTAELGAKVALDWLSLEAWAFHSWLDDAVVKAPRALGDCPTATPQCAASWFRYQLVNAPGLSRVAGVEGLARARLPLGFGVRATASWTFGEAADGVPLSRVPPANGTVELSWRHEVGFTGAAVVRWAGAQTRLAVADLSDARVAARVARRRLGGAREPARHLLACARLVHQRPRARSAGADLLPALTGVARAPPRGE
jgi:iron complex outermembrane receptor protein/hemoglobin/transferrin/lactoferrin receptor protein